MFSADFVNLFEINSNVPIVSSSPPSKKIPLNPTLRITPSSLTLKTGLSGRVVKRIRKNSNGYDLNDLHQTLIGIKKRNINERTIIFEPTNSVDYETIVKIMDEVILLRRTDEALYKKDSSGTDVRVKALFDDIIFGNIQS